ncbi:MAG: hypothetical protein ACI4NE_06070 [Succinivibrio sp.]
MERFNYISPVMKETQSSFIIEYDKKTKLFSLTCENNFDLDDVNFLCCIPELSFCEYVVKIYMRADNTDFLPKDDIFNFKDTIEIPFETIEGCTLMEGEEAIATIDATFTINLEDQIPT